MWKDKVKRPDNFDPYMTPGWVAETIAAGKADAEIVPQLKEWLKKEDGSDPSDASLMLLMDIYRGNYGD